METFSGVLPLFKPKGMTSHDCVDKLRKLFHTKKIGHTGTLDPDVDGVLPICIGRATRIAQYLTADSKAYRGIASLGKATTTEDAAGDIVEEKPVIQEWTRAEIEAVFHRFIGPIEQTPPMYSAIKINGKRLYEYAREGLHVERPTRIVNIHSLEIMGDDAIFSETIPFVVECSKGTYVRTLAVDIGRTLGYPGHLSALTRIRSGAFLLENCVTFSDIEKAIETNKIQTYLLSIAEALKDMKTLVVDDETAAKIVNGAVLPLPTGFQNETFTVYNEHGDCLAIYMEHPNKPGLMKPVKVLEIK